MSYESEALTPEQIASLSVNDARELELFERWLRLVGEGAKVDVAYAEVYGEVVYESKSGE